MEPTIVIIDVCALCALLSVVLRVFCAEKAG